MGSGERERRRGKMCLREKKEEEKGRSGRRGDQVLICRDRVEGRVDRQEGVQGMRRQKKKKRRDSRYSRGVERQLFKLFSIFFFSVPGSLWREGG
jgi:hypothetical protein